MSQKSIQIHRKDNTETLPFQTAWWKPFFSVQKEVSQMCKEACEEFMPAPANEFWKLQDEILADAHTQMHRVFGGLFNTRQVPLPWLKAVTEPNIDIMETPKAFKVTAELPGVEKEDLEISIVPGALIIHGRKNQAQTERRAKTLHRECYYGAFTRTVVLPEEADLNSVEANFEKNILMIDIAKKTETSDKHQEEFRSKRFSEKHGMKHKAESVAAE